MYKQKLKIKKTCELCGKEFETNKKSRHICYDDHYKVCPICGKEFKIDWESRNKQTCSKECMKILMSQKLSSEEVRSKTEATNIEKYGTKAPAQNEDIKKKTIKTNKEKYGVEHSSKLQETQNKKRKTTLEKYGVECVLQSNDIKDKIKQTNLERYGVENPSQNEDIKEKKKETTKEHYGVNNPMQSEEVKQKGRQTNLEKYGTEYPTKAERVQNKIKETNQKNYNCDYVFQSPDVQKKIKVTNQEKYGTIYPAQNKDIKEKIRQTNIEKYGGYTYQSEILMEKVRATNMEKYGTEYPSQTDEVKNKIKDTVNSKYGVDAVFQSQEVKEKIKETCLEKYGVDWNCMRPEARVHNTISHVNEAFAKLLFDIGIRYEMEFPIENRSYDFHIKDTNILIEIDPTITHNSYMSIFDNSNGRDKNYHLNKTELAEKNGYRCIHVFDWENWNKIFTLIQPTQSIYARKCDIVNVNLNDTVKFEIDNHIQESCKGQTICYGLYYNNELIEIMTFGKPRYNKHYEWELLRLCTKQGYNVIGGASKLFKHFIIDYNPKSIISYCDKSKFNGIVYEKIGMKFNYTTKPTKVWSKNNQYITNNLLLQRGYDQIFRTNYGRGTSNEELMLLNGWLPVYDCGQTVYNWNKS